MVYSVSMILVCHSIQDTSKYQRKASLLESIYLRHVGFWIYNMWNTWSRVPERFHIRISFSMASILSVWHLRDYCCHSPLRSPKMCKQCASLGCFGPLPRGFTAPRWGSKVFDLWIPSKDTKDTMVREWWLGISINGDTPKWMVYFMENSIKMDDN